MASLKVCGCSFLLTFCIILVECKSSLNIGFTNKLLRRSKRQSDLDICKSIQCDHGSCDPRRSVMATCACYDGWAGPLCNYRCRKNCGAHGKCSLFGNIENCKCDVGFSGEFCDKTIDAINVLPQQETLSLRHMGNLVYRQQQENNTVYDQRVCFPGFVCFNGICIRGHTSEGVLTVRCQCHQDWIGTFCHVQCSRRCQNGGRCYKDRPDGNEFCICPYNYNGPFCQNRKLNNRAFTRIRI